MVRQQVVFFFKDVMMVVSSKTWWWWYPKSWYPPPKLSSHGWPCGSWDHPKQTWGLLEFDQAKTQTNSRSPPQGNPEMNGCNRCQQGFLDFFKTEMGFYGNIWEYMGIWYIGIYWRELYQERRSLGLQREMEVEPTSIHPWQCPWSQAWHELQHSENDVLAFWGFSMKMSK